MIKTYLVPVSEELAEVILNKPNNILRDSTCLSGLTNGEIMQKAFPKAKILYIDEWEDYNNTHSLYKKAWVKVDFGYGEVLGFSLDWWNRKWGE